MLSLSHDLEQMSWKDCEYGLSGPIPRDIAVLSHDAS